MPACWHIEGNLRSAPVPARITKAFAVDAGIAALPAARFTGDVVGMVAKPALAGQTDLHKTVEASLRHIPYSNVGRLRPSKNLRLGLGDDGVGV